MISPLPSIMELDMPTDPLTLELPEWVDTNKDYRLTWSLENEAWTVLPLDVMLRKDKVTVIEDISEYVDLTDKPF